MDPQHNHLQGFAGEDTTESNLTFADTLIREWSGPPQTNIRERGELNFLKIRDLLYAKGAIDRDHAARWRTPTTEQLDAAKLRGLPEQTL